jgi:hypothetical protein
MDNYFLMMLRAIREQEELILYDNIFQVSELQQHQANEYLRQVYHHESLEYPHQAPSYDTHAGIWAAQTLYVAAQLLLYRQQNGSDLATLFTDFTGEKNASAILSADLTLRFLPDIIQQLDEINPEDELIPILEKQLYHWHYSGISHPLLVEKLDFSVEVSDPCVQQLYANRIIEFQRKPLAETPFFSTIVGASLGIFVKDYWKNYSSETSPLPPSKGI